MNSIPVSDLTQSLVELLKEAYKGPVTANSPTWFNDNDPNAGIFGQIAPLTAELASKSSDGSGKPGTTIASHIEHLRWSLANVNASLHGEEYNSNWKDSWTVITVDNASWLKLGQSLQAELYAVCEALPQQQTLPGEYLNGLISLVPHAAYHLATIRQIIERVSSTQASSG